MAMPIRGGIITYDIPSVAVLYNSYLPFISGGGLFIPHERKSNIGDDVFVAITLPGSSDRYPLNGKIVWLNQKATANRPVGFGIQFGSDPNSTKLRNEVERLLAGQLESTQPTYTM